MAIVASVHIFGMLRNTIRVGELEVCAAGDTVGDLIEELTARYGSQVKQELLDEEGMKQELLDEEGNLDYSHMIFVGGERVTDLQAKIQHGDEVVITGAFGGG
jgi:molybdopterin converting factor small subunit